MNHRSTICGIVAALCGMMPAVLQAQPAPPHVDETTFALCLSGLQGTAKFRDISADTFRRHLVGVQPDPSVLVLLNHQPEFTMHPWDYLAVLVDDERVIDGRAGYQRWQPQLQQISAQSGVPAKVVTGVWGVESNFGQNLGGRPLVQSLATLSCEGRRQTYFRGELAAALRILQEGHVAPDDLNGSWAGAFGQTQFMPSTFFESAVDFDGDGRRDIVGSVPDALASTARFLQNAGWRRDEPWGYEVHLPTGYNTTGASRKNKQPMAHWRQAGLTRIDGRSLGNDMASAGLLVPAPGGPAFLVGRNFEALYRYNASENYALAIGLLSDLIGDRSRSQAIVTPWPTDDPGLSRAQNKELQILLLARGHDIGTADGLIGEKTRQAIRQEQAQAGMKADGRAGQKILAHLRR